MSAQIPGREHRRSSGTERVNPLPRQRATGKGGHHCRRRRLGVTGQLAAERFGTGLPHGADAPGIARGLLRSWAGAMLDRDQLDTARLLVSELVSNAVTHGQGTITFDVWLRADALRVEVLDQGAAFGDDRRPPEAPLSGGWGLEMVRTQSSRWGISGDCARVWFELDLDGAPAASH
jgi:anti-sigma regulatory factor (Ser/Thr protein kinase)